MWSPAVLSSSNVTIQVLNTNNGSMIDRREHCYLSQQVINELGLTLNHDLGNFGQIRVFRRRDSNSVFDNSANFTVAGVAQGVTGKVIQVYPTSGIDEGGIRRLTGSDNPATLGNCEIKNLAPSQTRYTNDTGTEQVHLFTDLSSSRKFTECAEAMGNNRLILIVPHGGNIEADTSNQITVFKETFGNNSSIGTPTIWTCEGEYGSGRSFRQWHITSTDIHPHAFPALQRLLKETPTFLPGVPFQYAIALHGFSDNTKRLVIGGQAPDAVKMLIRDKIKAEMSDVTDVTYCIFSTNDILPLTDGLGTCNGVRKYRGTDNDNIINRLSPNPTSVANRGAIQIEQSRALRDTHSNAVAAGLAKAMAQLLQ